MCWNIKPAPDRISFSSTGDSQTIMHLGASNLHKHSRLGLLINRETCLTWTNASCETFVKTPPCVSPLATPAFGSPCHRKRPHFSIVKGVDCQHQLLSSKQFPAWTKPNSSSEASTTKPPQLRVYSTWDTMRNEGWTSGLLSRCSANTLHGRQLTYALFCSPLADCLASVLSSSRAGIPSRTTPKTTPVVLNLTGTHCRQLFTIWTRRAGTEPSNVQISKRTGQGLSSEVPIQAQTAWP